MAEAVGTTITEYFALDGGVTGETFTITNAVKGGGASWTGPTIVEVGDGEYTFTYTGNLAGVWKFTATGNTTGQGFTHAETFTTTSTRSFTRRVDGNTISASHVNELQQAIEDLSH